MKLRTKTASLLALAVGATTLLTAPPAFAAQFAKTDVATDVHQTSAVLNGHFDPEGDAVVNCEFEWGEDDSYGSAVPCVEGTAFSVPEDVSASPTLDADKTYSYRLRIELGSGEILVGNDRNLTTHPYPKGRPTVATFGSDGTSSSTFPTEYSQLAFDDARGRLYLLAAPSGLFGFDMSDSDAPSPLPGFAPKATPTVTADSGLAVDNSGTGTSGNIYVAGPSKIYGYDSNGDALAGNFPIDPTVSPGGLPENAGLGQSVCGVAVDQDGDIWVGKGSSERLLEYSSSGVFKRAIYTSTPGVLQRAPCRIVFDDEQNLFFTSNTGVMAMLLAPDYAANVDQATAFQPDQSGRGGIALDPGSGGVIGASPRDGLTAYAQDGSIIDVFGGLIADGRDVFWGVTSDSRTSRVYAYVGGAVNNAQKQIIGFGPLTVLHLPTVATVPADHVADSTVRLRGLVDPEGAPTTECYFQWWRGTSGNRLIEPCSELPGDGHGNVAVSATLTGLLPSTNYTFRLRASSADGPVATETSSFTTSGSAPHVRAVETLPAAARTNTSARLRGSLDPNGVPVTDCRFEWGTNRAYGNVASCTPDPGSGSGDVAVSAEVDGLDAGTEYHFRLVASNASGTTEGADRILVTRGPPNVETTGATVRAATSARLTGRLNARGLESRYRFEYGAEGPCAESPCEQTPWLDGGKKDGIVLVAQDVDGLAPDTTYYYRLVADNGNPAGNAVGGSMTITTRADDDPLEHGQVAGPTGSDRGWEQVTTADTSGNPVLAGTAFSDDGKRAIYQVMGGTPQSNTGSYFNQLFAERTEDGWETSSIYPSRGDATGNYWMHPAGRGDLSDLVAVNSTQSGANIENSETSFWHLRPGHDPEKVFGTRKGDWVTSYQVSADASRIVTILKTSADPEHPTEQPNLYDISEGTPRLISILPNGDLPTCGIMIRGGGGRAGSFPDFFGQSSTTRWVSTDGRFAYFPSTGTSPCGAPNQIYVRDIVHDVTRRVSPAPLSGPTCVAALIKSVDGAAFFSTSGRLAADDVAPSSCDETGGFVDVYRYDLADDSVECVTCVVPSENAQVLADLSTNAPVLAAMEVAVSEDGTRVYFASTAKLLPGADSGGLYRVKVSTGEIAYVGPAETVRGESLEYGKAISSDGRYYAFYSASAALNPRSGESNGGTKQFYIYDDEERSLSCVSCPQDGSDPAYDAVQALLAAPEVRDVGPNISAIADDGTFTFSTPNPLVEADDNTASTDVRSYAGIDVYEWRDGRQLIVSDGRTRAESSAMAPRASGITPSGDDIFFTQAAALTPDAPDAYNRLYDARIGGGFEFSDPDSGGCTPGVDCQGSPNDPPPSDDADSDAERPGNPPDCAPLERKLAYLSNGKRKLRAKLVSLRKRMRAVEGKRAKRQVRKRIKAVGAKRRSMVAEIPGVRRELDICGEGGQQ